MLLTSYLESLKQCSSLKMLETCLDQFLASYDITHYAFTYYSRHANSQNKLRYDYASKPYRSWHLYYLAENYVDIDSAINEVYRNTLPVFWDLHKQIATAKSLREKQMRLDSLQYGAVKGLSIPIHGPFEDFAIFMMHQQKHQNCLEHWESIQAELIIAAHYYYHFLKEILDSHQEQSTYLLSTQQLICLELTAQHYTVADIAKKLMIKERTVNFHLQKANKLLGTKNKHQSVMKAIEKGLLR